MHKKESNLINAAHFAIENNLVRNLSSVEVPLFSIGILSYGPGWIPTPSFNENQFNIDALNAANKQVWSAMFKDSPANADNDVPLSLLKNAVTAPAPNVEDYVVNRSKEVIVNFASNVAPSKPISKLNCFEREGLQWLKNAVKCRKIAVTQADKGGCILIVDPELIITSTLEKLNDACRYKCLGKVNPLPELKKDLLRYWKFAVLKNYVTEDQAKKTVGLIYKFDPNKKNPFTISTSDKFKPGIPYPYPLFKIHKLTLSELEEPNVRPPVRLVTDLHDGVTSRSDKFLVWKWLAPLCKDYAYDLVKDSSEALLKLEKLELDGSLSDSTLAFGLDVVSLYDSLKFDLVKLALNDAMESCRPEWDDDFREFLIDLTISSFDSAVVNFQGLWYGVEEGVPTGGIPSVSAANISVFFVFKKLIYTQENPLIDFLRFVDDGLGFFNGGISSFYNWFEDIRVKSVDRYGLDLTVTVNPVTTFTQFLDIQFKFNSGRLTTDIFRKKTDANRYLFFSSYHPRHVFRSVVLSQGMRYRRIINNDDILRERLIELKSFFIRSGYPERLISSILDAVPNQPRSLDAANNRNEKEFITPWVVTYGPGFDDAKRVEKDVNELLILSDTWKNENKTKIIQVVSRRAPNLKDLLFRRKALALDPEEQSGIVKCNGANCQTCRLVDNTIALSCGNEIICTANGNCKSWNVIYCFQCKLCNIKYVGKTVTSLNDRVNGHRSKFYKVLNQSATNELGEGVGH